MAFTYLILNCVLLAWALFLFVKNVHTPSKSWFITLGVLLALTLIFDSLAIWANFFSYAPDKILGLFVGLAPVEDFFYPLVAVIIVPALWKRFAPTGEKKESL